MTDWVTILCSVGAVIAGALINHRLTTVSQGQILKAHEERLDDHDRDLDNLRRDYVPRQEAQLQFTALKESIDNRLLPIKESQDRNESYLRYLAIGERPKRPE